MKKFILAFLLILTFSLSAEAADRDVKGYTGGNGTYAITILTTENPNISDVKNKITQTVYKQKANDKETAALLIAIASIETEKMTVDYPACDKKRGEACNIGIYKMNLFQQRKACPEITVQEINTNIKQATKCMMSGIDKYGSELWISWHRGGENWQSYKQEVGDYKTAIYTLRNKYLNTPKAMENNVRYTINIPGI